MNRVRACPKCGKFGIHTCQLFGPKYEAYLAKKKIPKAAKPVERPQRVRSKS